MAIFTAIAAAITAISSWTIGSFMIGNFLLRAAVQLGVSAFAKAFAGRNDTGPDPFAIQGNVRTGGNVPRSFVFGPSLTAGSLVFHTEWGMLDGTPNALYTQVIALSDIPVSGLQRWFVEGQAMTLAPNSGDFGFAAAEFTVDGIEHAWVRFHDGTQTVADSYLSGVVNEGAPRAYEASRIGVGVAYAVVTFRVNQQLFTGFPRSKFVLDGVKLYDVSRDGSLGGTGAHRWDDPATWGGDGDALPAVQAYNIARGIYYRQGETGGALLSVPTSWFYGMQGVTAARLPAAHWIAQIEKCRAGITGENGIEPIYRCAGEITVNSEIGGALDAILTSCAGRMSEVGGVFKIYVGAPDDPIAHFTDADIISLAPQTFTPFFGLSNTVNGVIATYPSPDEGYVMRSTPPLYNAAYEVEDGGRRLVTDVALSFVPFPAQAQRLLKGELAAARRARRHTFTLPARYRKVEPGDVVTWESARNGYAGKMFRVDGVIDLPNCDLIIDITEVDPTDHGAWVHGVDYVPINPSGQIGTQPPAQVIAGWSVEATSIVGADGLTLLAAILVRWDGLRDDVIAVRVQARLAATSDLIFDGRFEDVAAASGLVSQAIIGSTTYEVRGKYVPGTQRSTEWSEWLTVTTLNVGVGSAAFWAQLDADAQAAFDRFSGAFDQSFDRLAEFNIDARISDALAGARTDVVIDQLSQTVTAQIGSVSGQVTATSTALSSLDAAFAAYQVEVQSDFDTVSGFIDQNLYTIAEANAAIAASATTLSTQIGSLAATVNITAASIDGIEGVYGVKINNNGAVSGFGLVSALVDGDPVSDFIIDADAFRIGKSDAQGGFVAPFQVIGSAAYIKKAIIKDADIDTLKIGLNAVTVPVTSFSTSAAIGNGNWQFLTGVSVVMPVSGQSVLLTWDIAQGYSGSTPAWGFRLIQVNVGTLFSREGMTFGTDYPSGSFLVTGLPVGLSIFTLEWKGGSSAITANGRLTGLGVAR